MTPPPPARRRALVALSALALLAPALAACNEETTGPRVGALAKLSGDNQTTKVGTAVANPLVVLVVDGNSVPAPDRVVTWTVVAGHGALSVTVDTTGTDGRSQTLFTPDSSGTAIVTANSAGVVSAFTVKVNK